MDFHESSGPLFSMNGIPLARRSASTPISNSDAVESLLLLGKKPVISMDHQISLPAFQRSSTLPEHSNHGDAGLMVNYYQKMRLRNNEASKRCRLKRRIKQESLEKTRLLLDRQRIILSQRLNRLNKIKLILGEACKELNTKDSKLLRNTNLEEVLGADLSSDTLRPMRRGPRKHDYDSLLGADLSLGSSIHDTDAWSIETDGASSSGSTRSRSSMSRQEATEDDGIIILNSRMGGTMVERAESREALDLSSCSSKKEMNSLSARAASSETQQLVSLQEENRKLVAERTVLQTQMSEFDPRRVPISRSLPLLAPKPGNNSVFTNNSQVPRSSVIPGFNPATIILTPLTSDIPSTILTIPLPSRVPNSDSLSDGDEKIMPQTGEYSDGNGLQLSPESQGFNSLPPSPPQLRIVEEKLDLEDIKEEFEINERTADEALDDIKMDTQEAEEKIEGMTVYLKPFKEEENQSINPQSVESQSQEFNNSGHFDLPHCAAGNGDTSSCSGELFDLNALNQSLNLLDMKYKTAGPLTTPEKNVIKSRLGLAYWKADESPTWICSYHRHEIVHLMDTKSCSQCERKRTNKGSGKMFVITYRMGLELYMMRGKYLKIGLLVCQQCRITSLKDLDFSDSVCVDDEGVGLEKNPFSLPSFAVTSPPSSTLLPRVLSSRPSSTLLPRVLSAPPSSTLLPRVLSSPSASISRAISSPSLATTSLSSSTSGFSFPQKIIKGKSVSSKNDETEVITGSEPSWQDLIFTKIENLNESLQAINPRYKPLGFSITNLDSLSAGVLQDAVDATRIALQTVLTSIAPGHEAELWSAVKPGLDASLLGPPNSDG
ncbi:uncharacterized protein LOC111700673 isoform X2 [Eurytemora carolleeae]|uniref:uncharacterized protein LOC111700673 isoform X2 n=1 Tax=Eurytemora carolleeae TaxID=1294199 RepID=UPI000C771320|nr:uncharacterized protein LOC111700673 isoform X2 [Eurytemora carolleeae]|eukprot:XP_023327436.1 uncharacterized protein LOC111700673 isoform X2 [Eurytemora affinis]